MVVIYLPTKFRKAQSAFPERAWATAWLAVGTVLGSISNVMTRALIPKKTKKHSRSDTFCRYVGFICAFGIFLVPALGGIVTVGKMVWVYGDCHRLGD